MVRASVSVAAAMAMATSSGVTAALFNRGSNAKDAATMCTGNKLNAGIDRTALSFQDVAQIWKEVNGSREQPSWMTDSKQFCVAAVAIMLGEAFAPCPTCTTVSSTVTNSSGAAGLWQMKVKSTAGQMFKSVCDNCDDTDPCCQACMAYADTQHTCGWCRSKGNVAPTGGLWNKAATYAELAPTGCTAPNSFTWPTPCSVSGGPDPHCTTGEFFDFNGNTTTWVEEWIGQTNGVHAEYAPFCAGQWTGQSEHGQDHYFQYNDRANTACNAAYSA